jgi:catechol 2,3-dioxygenase-like lactoylglutathione lyase family enzyme
VPGSPAEDDPVKTQHAPAGALVYLFLFVSDIDAALDFYHRRLGLHIIETDDEVGVVKYDGHGVILATHKVGGDAACAVEMDLERPKGVATVFLVEDIERSVAGLTGVGVGFDAGVEHSEIGATARFHDPDGHRFFLYQPSPNALTWPSGAKLRGAERPADAAPLGR